MFLSPEAQVAITSLSSIVGGQHQRIEELEKRLAAVTEDTKGAVEEAHGLRAQRDSLKKTVEEQRATLNQVAQERAASSAKLETERAAVRDRDAIISAQREQAARLDALILAYRAEPSYETGGKAVGDLLRSWGIPVDL